MKILNIITLFNLLLLLACMPLVPLKAQDPHRFDPPWNTPPESTVNFTIAGINNVPDLHGDIVAPQLVVFFAGNQFMCIDELIAGFKKENPQIERVFVETLPPGILARQIKGGSLTIGNLRITHKPDIFAAGKGLITEMSDYFSQTETYTYNGLSLMVAKGNPKKITDLTDLAAEDLRVSMPNPAWEGIGAQIETAYKKAGGEQLRQTIMENKTNDGTTYLTRIHHRESPLRILLNESDVAPVWTSEIVYQKLIGHPVDEVKIDPQQNIRAEYMAARMKDSPRPEAANLFMAYMVSDHAKAIYRKYGFQTE